MNRSDKYITKSQLRSWGKRFSKWASTNLRGAPAKPGQSGGEVIKQIDILPTSEPAQEKQEAFPQLSFRKDMALDNTDILVQCALCGTIHVLSAVCHRCGAPVCEDQTHCRVIQTDKKTDMRIVYCWICAAQTPTLDQL